MRSEPTEFNNSCVSTDCYALVDEVGRTGVRIIGHYKAVGGRYLFHAGRRSDDKTMNAYWYSSEQNCCLSTCCSYIIGAIIIWAHAAGAWYNTDGCMDGWLTVERLDSTEFALDAGGRLVGVRPHHQTVLQNDGSVGHAANLQRIQSYKW